MNPGHFKWYSTKWLQELKQHYEENIELINAEMRKRGVEK
jgi:hypothetical protein